MSQQYTSPGIVMLSVNDQTNPTVTPNKSIDFDVNVCSEVGEITDNPTIVILQQLQADGTFVDTEYFDTLVLRHARIPVTAVGNVNDVNTYRVRTSNPMAADMISNVVTITLGDSYSYTLGASPS